MPWFLPEERGLLIHSTRAFWSGFQPSGSWWAATQPDGLGWYGKGLCPSRNEHSIRGFEERRPVYADVDGWRMSGLRGGSFTSLSSGDNVSPLLGQDCLETCAQQIRHTKTGSPYGLPVFFSLSGSFGFRDEAASGSTQRPASSSTSTRRKPLSGKFTDESRRNDFSS